MEVSKARPYKIIDSHAHGVPSSRPLVAQMAMRDLFDTWIAREGYGYSHFRALTDHTIDGPQGLLTSMERAGIHASVLLPVATSPQYVLPINQRMGEVVALHPGRLASLASFHPNVEHPQETLEQIKSQGFAGVKLHSLLQKFDPLSAKLFEIYSQLQRLGMIALFDTYQHPQGKTVPQEFIVPPETLTSPRKLAEINDKFPSLRMIAAHMGGLSQYADVERYLLGRDLYIDTSFAIFYAEREQSLRILTGHRSDRLLFGSDTPARTQEESVQKVLSFDLSLGLQRAIFQDNAVAAGLVNLKSPKIKVKDAVIWAFDDERDIVETLGMVMESAGFSSANIKLFTDPREWSQTEGRPDLVITDMNMGVDGLNGRQLLEAIKGKFGDSMPHTILICSPRNDQNRVDIEFLREEFGTTYFLKPVRLEQLEQRLFELFEI